MPFASWESTVAYQCLPLRQCTATKPTKQSHGHGISLPGNGQMVEARRFDGLLDASPAGVIAVVQQNASQVC